MRGFSGNFRSKAQLPSLRGSEVMARQSLKKKISIFFSGTGNTMTGCTNSFLKKPKGSPSIFSPWKNNYKKLAIWEGHGPKTTLHPQNVEKSGYFTFNFFVGGV